jgi:hypothetical protein
MQVSTSTGRSTRLAGPKRIGALSLAMAASVGLVACGGSGSTNSKSLSGKATGVVTYWDRSGIALPPAMVKQFNASHKGLNEASDSDSGRICPGSRWHGRHRVRNLQF